MENINTKEKEGLMVDYEDQYHTKRHKDHQNPTYYQARAKIALKKFFNEISPESNLLDYGCGLGQNIYYLKNAIGYDISKYGLGFCRQKGIRVTDSLDELKDESFDYVFSSHVLEHHPNPKEMISNMHRKLKKGSDLILVIPFEKHTYSDFDLDLNQHLFSWNFRTINNLLITSGFKIKINKYLRGAGYNKLLPFYSVSFKIYFALTNMVSRIFGIKEIMVVATKI